MQHILGRRPLSRAVLHLFISLIYSWFNFKPLSFHQIINYISWDSLHVTLVDFITKALIYDANLNFITHDLYLSGHHQVGVSVIPIVFASQHAIAITKYISSLQLYTTMGFDFDHRGNDYFTTVKVIIVQSMHQTWLIYRSQSLFNTLWANMYMKFPLTDGSKNFGKQTSCSSQLCWECHLCGILYLKLLR